MIIYVYIDSRIGVFPHISIIKSISHNGASHEIILHFLRPTELFYLSNIKASYFKCLSALWRLF